MINDLLDKNFDYEHTKWLFYMALMDIKGLGNATVKNLYIKYLSVTNILSVLARESVELTSYEPMSHFIRTELDKADWHKYLKCCEDVEKIGAKIVTIEDANFPANLLETSNPPPLLYYKGNLDTLSPYTLACVGTLQPSEKGAIRARKFCRLCAENGIDVISGLAKGIDTESHTAALEYNGRTYAVVAHGLKYQYPKENAELYERIAANGAVISQFPPKMRPQRWTFPARNEVMCSMSLGTVIIEAHEKCGSIIQAHFSLKHGRPVFILDSNFNNADSAWAYKLLKQGAYRVKDFKDVLDILQGSRIESDNQRPVQPELFTMSHTTNNPHKKAEFVAILFDLDGVIFDARPVMLHSYKAAISHYRGGDISDEAILKDIWMSPPALLRRFGVTQADAHQRYKEEYVKQLDISCTFFNEVLSFIKTAKANGIKVGIVTSQPRSRYDKIIRKSGIADLIDMAITWNDVPRGKAKPDPVAINTIVDHLNIEPRETIYIGDLPNDILAARNAKVWSAAVLWGLGDHETLQRYSPDFIFAKPAHLQTLLSS